MIRQGSNKPIVVTFEVEPEDISITLHNEISVLKHWSLDDPDLTASEDGLTYTASYTQEESFGWEEGPCSIEIRWMDSDGNNAGIVQKKTIHEVIEHTVDQTVIGQITEEE